MYYVTPRTNEVKYVGETINPQTRMRGHRYHPNNIEMKGWINELKGLGRQPIMKILSTVSRGECRNEEQLLIRHYQDKGCLLFNKSINDGRSGKKVHKSWANRQILWKETGHIFNSAEEAGRYFGFTGGTILNNMKR